MQIPDTATPPDSLAVVSCAVVFALLDALIEKDILSRTEIQNVLQTAAAGVAARAQLPYGVKAHELMGSLRQHFADRQV